MPVFEQEWISPILEVYRKEKITNNYTVLLGLNPLGQALCRKIYEKNFFETVLLFNSPSFTSWNRYPAGVKPPVIPVHGMIRDELMMIWGDVSIKDYEWLTDTLFYIRGNIPTRFIVAFVAHSGPTSGQVFSKKGERLLERLEIPRGRSEYYDGLTAPLISVANVANLDPVIFYVEDRLDTEQVIQIDDVIVTQGEIDAAEHLMNRGFDLQLADQ
ncbi:MAG: hypothetical protein BAJATHORv1_10076 [Candidatus Thorarchaeota archaeon]|nr:MAG: hypothetical protein BAJATHORv1_10076 [Candidatus Thorarchaeota archaeon]